jgi:hypothetical protein
MPARQILQEAVKLNRVSENLGKLAEEHAPVTKALTIMARTIRHSAMLLEVLVALRLGPAPALEGPTN